MGFLSLLSLISSSQVLDGPHATSKWEGGGKDGIPKHPCPAVGARHQLSVGKAVEVTEAAQQSHPQSFST